MNKLPRILALFAALMLLMGGSAQAASTHLKTEGAWSVYTFEEGGSKVCFISANPASAKGDYKKRGEIYAMVTERPADSARNIFSYKAGYTYDSKAPITLTVGSKTFTLYTTGSTPETAWAATQEDDNAITAALGSGKTMVIKGRSARGSDTTDSFSLNGFGKALQAAKDACASPKSTEKSAPRKD